MLRSISKRRKTVDSRSSSPKRLLKSILLHLLACFCVAFAIPNRGLRIFLVAKIVGNKIFSSFWSTPLEMLWPPRCVQIPPPILPQSMIELRTYIGTWSLLNLTVDQPTFTAKQLPHCRQRIVTVLRFFPSQKTWVQGGRKLGAKEAKQECNDRTLFDCCRLLWRAHVVPNEGYDDDDDDDDDDNDDEDDADDDAGFFVRLAFK